MESVKFKAAVRETNSILYNKSDKILKKCNQHFFYSLKHDLIFYLAPCRYIMYSATEATISESENNK